MPTKSPERGNFQMNAESPLFLKMQAKSARRVQAFIAAFRRFCLHFANPVRNPDTAIVLHKFKHKRNREKMMTHKITALTLFILLLANVTAQAQTCTDSANSYIARGDAFFGKGDYRRALKDYDMALAFDRESAESWNKRALAQEGCGNLAAAVDDFNHALALAPDSAIYLSNRARIFLQQGKIAQALDDLNLAIQQAPTFADAYAHRGLVYAAQDELNSALADFDHALQYNSKLINTRINRGLALLRMGRKEEAAQAFAQFRRMGGQFSAAQQELFKQLADAKQ